MSTGDTLDYILILNPVSRALIFTGATILRAVGLRPNKIPVPQKILLPVEPPSVLLGDDCLELMAGTHYNFVRLAGLSGASAILMAGICKYMLRDMIRKDELGAKEYADCATRLHFFNSFTIMVAPLAHFPVMTGTLMVAGTVLFCGSMYYRALTGGRRVRPIATAGITLMIASWISLVI